MIATLASAPGFRIEDYRCAGRSTRTEERIGGHEIVFVRRGAFRVETARGRALVDTGTILALHRGEEYRVDHPAGCGDRCLVVGIDDAVLAEHFGTASGLDERRPEAPFRALTADASPPLHARAMRFAERLADGDADPLLAAEGLATLVPQALGEPTRRRADLSLADRRSAELAEAVRLTLSRRLGERLTLAELAAPLGVSAFFLARSFRRSTGHSIHRYRTELRLREAYDRLLDGERDLTALALGLGFADHAHFTNAFRRRFGAPPSRVRGGRRAAEFSAPRPTSRPPGAA